MLDDKSILEFYVEVFVDSMKELIQLAFRENELLKSSNVLNRKKNVNTIKREYQEYLDKLCVAWSSIYEDDAQFATTLKNEDSLVKKRTVYAITLYQRHVEQFFFQLYIALIGYTREFDDKFLGKKNESDLINSFSFSFVKSVMNNAFFAVLKEKRNHNISVDENRMESFVETNKNFLKDLYINYKKGEKLTDDRIDQLLKDIDEGKRKKQEEEDEGISKGSIRIEFATYSTKEELQKGLDYESCRLLENLYGGSSIYYDSLPTLPSLISKDIIEIICLIDEHARNVTGSEEELLKIKETNALYLGLATGYSFLHNMTFNHTIIKTEFLQNDISPLTVPDLVLNYMGLESDSDEPVLFRKLNDNLLDVFTFYVMYPSPVKCPAYKEPKEKVGRTVVAIMSAFTVGYHAYFRYNKVLPGNTYEEDDRILHRLASMNGVQRSNEAKKYIGTNERVVVNKSVSTDDEKKKTTVVSDSGSSKKYWCSDEGTIKCPGDNCIKECDMECPIYLQTLAMPLFKDNEFEEAAKLLKKAVEIEPAFADAWNNLAACYGMMGKHWEAFSAYSMSYELNKKPNPLYGMAVAKKKLKDYSLAMRFAKKYQTKFGTDERISSLIAELSEILLSVKMNNSNEAEVLDIPSEQDCNSRTSLLGGIRQNSESAPVESIKKPEDKNNKENMRKYGKLMLQILDEDKRVDAYAEMEKLESQFPEAGVIVGQYYQGTDQRKASDHFKIAADAHIHEGEWGYAANIPHSHIPVQSNSNDVEWETYCLRAAEGGCPDAANEMGNICYRRNCIVEATYWYGMAYYLECPQALAGVKGILQKWIDAGKPEDYKAGTNNFSKNRHEAALCYLKIMSGVNTLDDLMRLCLAGETFAGLSAAYFFEKGKNDEMAFKAYNALAFEKNPNAHVLRCCADMMISGKGTEKDIDGALKLYKKAAKGGNAVAMYVMGQKAIKENDPYLAACWFGQAYARGFEMAGESLSGIAEEM